MAEKGFGYVGSIPNAGAAVVPAPAQVKEPKKGKVNKGQDLRTGK